MKERNIPMNDIRLLLDNVRSTHNVGSIFRTAEAVAVSRIYCLGTTPAPTDRFGRKRKDVAKVALGAEDMIPWEYVENKAGIQLVKKLKKEGFQVIAVEQDTKSVDYKKVKMGNKALIILGNEVDAVSKDLLKVADIIAEIPMKGKKESLNVSVTAGIALFKFIE